MNNSSKDDKPKPIYVLSGGKGLAGNNMVQSLLIQYPNNEVPVIIVPDVMDEKKLLSAVLQAKKDGGLITHTMVIPSLRKRLIELAQEHDVPQVDFMGELASYLDKELGISSLQSPGLFREINQQYFNRIDAIEFTLTHDDGMSPQRLKNAEIILCGVSRSGKTPLSVYLAMWGWKVANVPLVKGIDPPKELFEVDPKRVFGLHIGVQHLITHRIKRLKAFNNVNNPTYVDDHSVKEEIRNASMIFKRGGFTVINVSNKPVESTANEVLAVMTKRFDYGGRKIKSPYHETDMSSSVTPEELKKTKKKPDPGIGD